MPDSRLVVAIDQGTSSTKVVVVDAAGAVVARSSVPLGQSHPQQGWVEQDAEEIFASVTDALANALEGLAGDVAAIGLSSQRESAVAWNRVTGKALSPVLGWQDRRTIPRAQQLVAGGAADRVREVSGLPIDPMFSALKFEWILDAIDTDRAQSSSGAIALGTVDSWLLFRLTGEHRIEMGNASRTQLLDLDGGNWSDELLELFRIPRAALPVVVASTLPSAPVTGIAGIPENTRIFGVLGDSHAALFGHGARTPGAVKVTYGTGSSVMGLLPAAARPSGGLVRTIAWATGDHPGRAAYAFEGNILSTGATLVWLAGILGTDVDGVFTLAASAEANGVSFVPAFSGLGAPWWDETAQALVTGFTLGSDRANLARAAVESIAFQVEDVLAAADAAVGTRIATILADGGPTSNAWLMQLQADLSQRDVVPASVVELSALGAAHLAGLSAGLWTEADLATFRAEAARASPVLAPDDAHGRRTGWLSAVARSRTN